MTGSEQARILRARNRVVRELSSLPPVEALCALQYAVASFGVEACQLGRRSPDEFAAQFAKAVRGTLADPVGLVVPVRAT